MAEMEEKTNVTPRSNNPKDIESANKISERYRKAHEMLHDPENRSTTMRWIADPSSYQGEVTAEMKTVKQVYQGFQVVSSYFCFNLDFSFQKPIQDKVSGYLMDSLTMNGSDDHKAFVAAFNDRIHAVNKLDDQIRSQWSGNLTMAYHWWKHERDFTGNPITIEQYFEDYANNIFSGTNSTTTGFTQTGATRISYTSYFGGRAHVGFMIGENTRTSHFVKGFSNS